MPLKSCNKMFSAVVKKFHQYGLDLWACLEASSRQWVLLLRMPAGPVCRIVNKSVVQHEHFFLRDCLLLNTVQLSILQVIKCSIRRIHHIEIATGWDTTFPATDCQRQFVTYLRRRPTTSRYKRGTTPVMGPCRQLSSSEHRTVCDPLYLSYL